MPEMTKWEKLRIWIDERTRTRNHRGGPVGAVRKRYMLLVWNEMDRLEREEGETADPRDRWIALARAAIAGGSVSVEHASSVLHVLAKESGYTPCPMDREEDEPAVFINRASPGQGDMLGHGMPKPYLLASCEIPGMPTITVTADPATGRYRLHVVGDCTIEHEGHLTPWLDLHNNSPVMAVPSKGACSWSATVLRAEARESLRMGRITDADVVEIEKVADDIYLRSLYGGREGEGVMGDREWIADEALAVIAEAVREAMRDRINGPDLDTFTLRFLLGDGSLLSPRARAIKEAVEAAMAGCTFCAASSDDCAKFGECPLSPIRRVYLGTEAAKPVPATYLRTEPCVDPHVTLTVKPADGTDPARAVTVTPAKPPCAECGDTGRVPCPEWDKCHGGPGAAGCEMTNLGGNDVDCTISCPDCKEAKP